MKTVILAGGFGTRLSEETVAIPKPMVSIGGKPLIWHIMKIYGFRGFRDFCVALGYKAEVVKNYFIHFSELEADLAVDLKTGKIDKIGSHHEDWKIQLIDTGINTLTGGRLKRIQRYIGNNTFMLTYGDGVTDLDINKVIAMHKKRGKLATVTAVRPTARFGGIHFKDDLVISFAEKQKVHEGWVNGGFMVMEPGVFDYLNGGDGDVLELDLLERLAANNQLAGYKHEGYWQCMDTLRERQILEEQWASGKAPWKLWKD